jgi:DNA-binding CsgD family transcriptional regulator
VLTPREWEVLALVREGLTNEQIAERLGVSLSTAKFHVSEIMGKLGVESRGEAAAWDGRPRQRRRALGMVFGLARRVESHGSAKALGVGAIVLALFALLALAIGVALMRARSTPEDVRAQETPEVTEAVTETEVIVYRPTNVPADREQGETCIVSGVLNRDGAWACSGGRSPGLTDPCFGEEGALEVVCPGRPEPGFRGAYVLELDQPLVFAAATPVPGAPTPVPPDPAELSRRVWWVETADGRMCGFKAGGTAPVVNGERINFWCGDGIGADPGTGLLGLPTPGKVWTARQVPLELVPAGTIVTETIVELRTVWR